MFDDSTGVIWFWGFRVLGFGDSGRLGTVRVCTIPGFGSLSGHEVVGFRV